MLPSSALPNPKGTSWMFFWELPSVNLPSGCPSNRMPVIPMSGWTAWVLTAQLRKSNLRSPMAAYANKRAVTTAFYLHIQPCDYRDEEAKFLSIYMGEPAASPAKSEPLPLITRAYSNNQNLVKLRLQSVTISIHHHQVHHRQIQRYHDYHPLCLTSTDANGPLLRWHTSSS